MQGADLRERREAIVREHLASENAHDFDATIATFGHPRYELVALHHADDAVIVEVDVLGTHLGPLRALLPTGRAFRCRASAHFLFEGDRLVCERAYFDQLTVMRQLGLAHDSRSLAGRLTMLVSHPLTIGRALARRLRVSRSRPRRNSRSSGTA